MHCGFPLNCFKRHFKNSSVEKINTMSELTYPDTAPCQNVVSKDEVLKRIDSVIHSIVQQISNGESPTLRYNSRTSWENVEFHEDVGLQVQDHRKMTNIRFDSQHSVKKFNLTLKVLAHMYRLIQSDRYSTKRDLYYQDTSGFGNQNAVDDAVDNISCMLQVSRWSLHVLATSKGCVAGNLSFQDTDGNFVDCRATKTGILIPVHVKAIQHMETNAKVILVVEKDATFQTLLDSGVINKLNPCIIITGKGFPDVNTRMMLRRLWDTFHIPIMALVDADPHGIEIMAIYKYGSRALSHETKYLAVPSTKWLGVLPSDIKRFRISPDTLLPLTKTDREKATELLSRPYAAHHQTLCEENPCPGPASPPGLMLYGSKVAVFCRPNNGRSVYHLNCTMTITSTQCAKNGICKIQNMM